MRGDVLAQLHSCFQRMPVGSGAKHWQSNNIDIFSNLQ
jgi:hypothetical protein